MSEHQLQRNLNFFDSMMLNIGSMVGSGIFFVPATVALYLPEPSWFFLVWIVGGLVSLLGALSIAELGAAMPWAGGQYVYLREAYGPIFGFLAGWGAFAVIMTGSIAAVAVACMQCLSVFFPITPLQIQWFAVLSIWVLTVMNCWNVKWACGLQNGMTLLKILAIAGLVVLGLALPGGSTTNFLPFFSHHASGNLLSLMGLGLVAVLWAYDGWVQVTYVAGEIQEPQRNLPRVLLFSTLVVIALYCLMNFVDVYLLPTQKMGHSLMVAGDAIKVVLGTPGVRLVSICILVSTFGANNGFILGGARIYYAMAKDNAFFPQFAKVSQSDTPTISLIAQAIWSSLLVFSGSFEQLFTDVIFASWVFYALSCGAIFILRRKYPDLERPYKVWGYPWTPIVFILFALGLVINTLYTNGLDSLVGVGIILLGLPAYYYCKRHAKFATPESPESKG